MPISQPSDHAQHIPLSDQFWKYRNMDEWLKEQQTNQSRNISNFTITAQIVLSIVDERLIKNKNATARLLTSRLQSIPGGNNGRTQDAPSSTNVTFQTPSNTQYCCHPLTAELDRVLSPGSPVFSSSSPDTSGTATLHLMAALRHVRLRSIYAHTEWQTSEHEIQETRKRLKAWIVQDKVSAKKCLWHAASAFRILRSQSRLAVHEPFVILISVLIMRAYCALAPTGDQQSTNIDGGTSVTIDQLTDEAAVDEWIAGDDYTVFLTGVGRLVGPETDLRLLSALHNILGPFRRSSHACRAVSFGIECAMAGQHPIFREDAK